jgi:hypothetical protein
MRHNSLLRRLAEAYANPLKRLCVGPCVPVARRCASVICKLLISHVRRYCVGLRHSLPHTPYRGRTPLGWCAPVTKGERRASKREGLAHV